METELKTDYIVLSLDFQKISDASFKAEEKFVKAFCRQAIKKKRKTAIPEEIINALQEIVDRKDQLAVMDELFDIFDDWCSTAEKPVVLIVDEVDTAQTIRFSWIFWPS